MMFAGSVSVKSVAINGKVTNLKGTPVNNAVVALSGKNMKDTTDAAGAFLLSDGDVSADPIRFLLPRTEEITLNEGMLRISLAKPAAVKIVLFDMQGNKLNQVLDSKKPAGAYRFDLKSFPIAARMVAVRVSVGGRAATFRYLSLSEGIYAATPLAVPALPAANGVLSKVTATVDSLKVSAPGYVPKTVPLPSYETTVNITLDSITLAKFSFFVTSLKALREWSGSENGFGGDLRFGKTGQGAGLLGADSICQCIAEKSMPGSKVKQWRAFLSVSKGPDGSQVNAIDRIGKGPWYDRLGRVLSNSVPDLLNTRPASADDEIKNDLPNEDGVPNHRPDPAKPQDDNHHMITGTGTDGKLYSTTSTCEDWTSATTANSKPYGGLAWPRGGSVGGGTGLGSSHWMSGLICPGCKAGVAIVESGGPSAGCTHIGCGGGYGGFYCFALNP